VRTMSSTNRSRGVWSRREGSEESIGGALKSAKLCTAFKGAEDEFFGRTKSEDTATRGCVKRACVEDMRGGIVKPCVPQSRPLTLVTGEGVMWGGAR